MSMSVLIWAVLMATVLIAAYMASRLGEKNDQKGFKDTGLAILEFGRAFPEEAIRELRATSDGDVVFVRLHDNKAGFMRSQRGHYSCYLIEPGSAQVSPTPDARGLIIEFIDAPHQNNIFVFDTPAEAAEVSLWLLGSLVPSVGGISAQGNG